MRVYLETERMVLREFTTGDAGVLYTLDTTPGVLRYIGGEPPVTPASARNDLARFLALYRRYGWRFGYWVAHRRAVGEFLGWSELKPPEGGDERDVELGYRLHPAAWGRGYATEGAGAGAQGVHRTGRAAGVRRDDGCR